MALIPGEKLVERLWETIAEKGIGALLKPGQIKREGLAQLQIERAKSLIEAQTSRDVDSIKNGQRNASDFSLDVGFRAIGDAYKAARIEPVITDSELEAAIERQSIKESMRREINATKAILIADEQLRADEAVPPTEKVEEDWLHRWKNCASEVSADELQGLWGKILAGEVKKPGTYTLRCLEFIRNISQTEAKLIEKMCAFAISNGYIWRPDSGLRKYGLEFDELLDLQELGIVTGIEGMMHFTVAIPQGAKDRWQSVIVNHEKCLIAYIPTEKTSYQIPVYPITNLGRQLLGLSKFSSTALYINDFGSWLKSQGMDVIIGDVIKNDNTGISWINGTPI
ncbi:DUF2806 domain-containing protein [Pseudomonas japonica]|uniref:TIGR03899 family protein n=1 Tax=Pseudomonas japonica TaxID=256466 RepID=A0A239BU32_9PSED|nr:DUF2806 domain-containing protein [Pseudomonas japonica]SNS11537.1 Protein of unknown function [Pseudomonas japonica]